VSLNALYGSENMFLIRVKDDFCAAHFLKWTDGTSEPLHGHNWKVEVVVACPKLDGAGIGINYLFVYKHLHELLDNKLDHKNLNFIDGLKETNPTSELLAKWIFDKISITLKDKGKIKNVTVWETDSFGVTYEP